jgi:phage shock protein A
MSTVVKAKMNTIMDRVEDPNETLDYSYQKQLELLQNVKRGVAEVATSKKRLELQRARLAMKIDQLDSQAREAIKGDREDLARQALERKSALSVQIEGLDREIADLAREQEKLEATDRRLTAKVESFRAKKETIKAQYSAAEAQVKVTESLTGISEEMADVGLAVQRSEDKIETMRARSAALDELVERGTLEEFAGGDEVERELARIKAKSSVEDDLARLKAEEGR